MAKNIFDMQLYFSDFLIDMLVITVNVVQIECMQTSTFSRPIVSVNNDSTNPFLLS